MQVYGTVGARNLKMAIVSWLKSPKNGILATSVGGRDLESTRKRKCVSAFLKLHVCVSELECSNGKVWMKDNGFHEDRYRRVFKVGK